MKIAIVHDSLYEIGGAERFLKVLMDMYPAAHLYTLFIEERVKQALLPSVPDDQIHTSILQYIPITSHGSLVQCISPLVWRTMSFEHYDLVISSSSFFLANTIAPHKPIHIQYIHSLPKNVYRLVPLTQFQRLSQYTRAIQRVYEQAVRSGPFILTNSNHMKQTIEHYVGVRSKVIYPPVYIPRRIPQKTSGDYYLCVSRIDSSKNLELAIQACTRLKLHLKIVGQTNEPSYERYLRSIAGPMVEFLGFLSDKEVHKLYGSAIAFIFPAKNEDFGIAPVEAMSFGVPVIAYHGGGVAETIIEGKTGHFFYEHTASSLLRVLKSFHPERFSADVIHRHAYKFREDLFKEKMKKYIAKATSVHP